MMENACYSGSVYCICCNREYDNGVVAGCGCTSTKCDDCIKHGCPHSSKSGKVKPAESCHG